MKKFACLLNKKKVKLINIEKEKENSIECANHWATVPPSR